VRVEPGLAHSVCSN